MININDWKNSIITGGKRVAIPVMTHPGIEMIGLTVEDAVRNGEVHARAIKRVNETYPVAATTLIMDLTLEAEAFGCTIEFQENEMPHITGRLINSPEEIEQLVVPGLNAGRMGEYLKANRLVVEAATDKPVFAGAIGPFSLAGRLYDMSEIMMACYTHEESIHLLLEKCTAFILNYCHELKNIGCSGVVIAEPAAGLLSNDDSLTFSGNYIRNIVHELKDDTFMIVLHNCGNHGHCTDAMFRTGADAFHFGNAIDMVETLKCSPPEKLIMGNVDPVGIMKSKNAHEVKAYVGDLLRKTSSFNNFILSTGCDLPPHVPEENIRAYFEALDEYNSI